MSILPLEIINAARTDLSYYEVGNMLRGYFGGRFASDEEAWEVLTARFDKSFPSMKGRQVEMRKTIRLASTPGNPKQCSSEKLQRILDSERQDEKG